MSLAPELASSLWRSAEVGTWERGRSRRARVRFVAFPGVDDVRILLPWRPTSVIAASARTSDDRPRFGRWRDAAGATVLLTVGAATRTRRIAVASEESLVVHVAEILGRRSVGGVVICGPPCANRKPVVQLHDRWGRTLAFVKVAWNDLTRRLLDAERETLERLATIPDKPFRAPPVLAHGSFGEATWVALGPVSVERRRRPDTRSVDELALAIEATAPRWDGETATSPFVSGLATASDGLRMAGAAVVKLVDRWGDQELSLRAGHGDFVPWNIQSGDPRPAVWDWERYSQAVPIGFDRIHHRVQVGWHRQRRTIASTLDAARIGLDHILPELSAGQRRAHLEWYVADLLTRYERDGAHQHRPEWSGVTAELSTALTDLMKENLEP